MPIDRSQFTTRDAIESFSLQLYNEATGFLAPYLFPEKLVSKSLTKVYQYDSSHLLLHDTRAPTDATAPQVDWNVFSRNITLEEHKLRSKVNPRDARDADVPVQDFEMDAARTVMQGLLIKKEDLAATLATTAANYPSDLTSAIASGSRWNESGGTPETDATTAHNALVLRVGKKANAVAMSGTTFRKLKLSPNFQDRVKYVSGGPVTADAVKALFDVEHLFVSDSVYESAKEGATSSLAGLWGTNVIFFCYNPSPALRDVSYGHCTMLNQLWSARYQDDTRRGSAGQVSWVEMGMEYKLTAGFVVSSSDSDFAGGYLYRTAVS